MTTPAELLLAQISLPGELPTEFAMKGHTSHDDPLARFVPGLEGSYIDRTGDTERDVAFSVHAIADADWKGQWMYIQLAVRKAPDSAFGNWCYAFCYRTPDVDWRWIVDTVTLHHRSHAEFGQYVDEQLR